MKSYTHSLAVLLILLAPFPVLAQSGEFSLESKPVWEAGIGAGLFNGVDYPGSRDPNDAQFVLPFFIYRSGIFRVGDGGVGAIAVEEPRLKLDVSFGGALNADSEPGSVREGLPDLDLLLEFGPRLQYKLFEKRWNNNSKSRLNWDTSLRAAFSTDFESARTRGFVLSTGLAYRQTGIAGDLIDLIFNTDISFGDERYADFFYTVSPEFVTPQREAFNARAGYIESRAFLGLAIRPIDSLRLFTGVAFFSYANAANEDSPLFETDNSTQFALGFAWSAFRSKRTIDVFGSD